MGNSVQRKKLWAFRESKNKCIYCGKRKPVLGTKGCSSCKKKKVAATCRFAKANPNKQKDYRRKIRFEVLKKYGGQCQCCHESSLQFLAIDHINNDGAKERRELYGSNMGASHRWFLKLRREPVREDLRVLCHNCNMALFQFGKCPHEQREEKNQAAVS